MTGDINFFRKRFLGGFNKEDVVGYVAKLAQERNELESAKEKAESLARALAGEVASLRLEMDEAKRAMSEKYNRKASVFAVAEATFAEYYAAFEKLSSELDNSAGNIISELENAGSTTSQLKHMLSQAKEKLGELEASFQDNSDAADSIDIATQDNHS